MVDGDTGNYAGSNIEVKRRSIKLKGIIYIFLGLTSIAIFLKINNPKFINPVIESHALTLKEIKSDNTKRIPIDEIKNKISEELNSAQGSYSVYFYDILSGDSFGINEQTILTAASVNKIPILAALYYFAGKGVIDLDKIIVPQAKDIQDYGTGSIRYDKLGTPYSTKTLARLII